MIWLAREVRWWRHHPPPALLEWAGSWSYSLYLFHIAAPAAVGVLLRSAGRPELPALALSLLRVAMVFPLCYAFARLVEFPSWSLARRVGARLRA
jgi:peptidoglycan/LPS O-acetylase OafA/YrhL